MLQTAEQAPARPASQDPQIIAAPDGQPLYALIDYELYLALQETIREWYAAQRAADDAQAWYWTPAWQRMEAEAQADLREGRSRTFNTMTELIHDLQSGDDDP